MKKRKRGKKGREGEGRGINFYLKINGSRIEPGV